MILAVLYLCVLDEDISTWRCELGLLGDTTMSFTFRQGDLPKLDLQVDRGTDFKAWKAQWQAYFSLSGLDEQPAAKQLQALTLCFSRETISIVDNLGLSSDQRAGVDTIIEAIERYVQGQIPSTQGTPEGLSIPT